jgi:Ca-activated chloride channel family protein
MHSRRVAEVPPAVPAACCAALAALVYAAPAAQQATFRSGIRTVAVYATVHDEQNRLVRDLPRDAFEIFDEERKVAITVFSSGIQPITVAVMLDTSTSMATKYERVRDSALAFVRAMRPEDRARIGTFGAEITTGAHLTSDPSELERVLREELWPGGNTPLWGALSAAMDALAGESGRRVVLVLTDGADTGGLPGWKSDRAGVEKQAIGQDFMLYAINFFTPGMSSQAPRMSPVVADLADRTGGAHFEVPESGDLAATFTRVAEELRHQYLLGFIPDALDGRTHRLYVSMTRPGLTVRAKKSYIAAADR